MPVGLPHQRVGDLMQERVVNRLVCSSSGVRVGEGDDLRTIVATARAFRGVIKLETPTLELVRRDPGPRTGCNGLQFGIRTLAGHRSKVLRALQRLQSRVGDAVLPVIITDDVGGLRIEATDGAVEHCGADLEAHAVTRMKLGTHGVCPALHGRAGCPHDTGEPMLWHAHLGAIVCHDVG